MKYRAIANSGIEIIERGSHTGNELVPPDSGRN